MALLFNDKSFESSGTWVTTPRVVMGRQQRPSALRNRGKSGVTMLSRMVVRICAPTSAYLKQVITMASDDDY